MRTSYLNDFAPTFPHFPANRENFVILSKIALSRPFCARAILLWDFDFTRSERGDVAEALDEVFLDDGCISLEEAKTIGSGTALDGDALDVRVVADCDEREAIGGRKLNALWPECGLESDFIMLAGEWVFIQAEAE